MFHRALVFVLSLLVAVSLAPARADEGDPAPPDTDAVVAGLKSDEDAARLAAAEQALAVADEVVTKPLARLLTDERFEIRAAAIRALGARSTERTQKEAAKVLCARLPHLAKSAQDEGEVALVVQALHDLRQPSSIAPLMDGVEDSTSEALYRARVMAVANVPHPDAVDELIQHLARRGRGKWGGLKRYVVEALRDATGENLGADPDAWRAWWKEAKKGFDFEAAAARRAAGHEQEQEREERKKERKERRNKGDSGDSE